MNLAKRSALVVLPVILLAYSFAAWQVHRVQARALLQLEQGRVDAIAESLGSTFQSYHLFLTGLLVNIRDGERLSIFLHEKDVRYRDATLGFGLGEIVDVFQQNSVEFVSFSIVEPGGHVQYYFENSNDPFAKVRGDHLHVAAKAFRAGTPYQWEHLKNNGKSTLVLTQLVDSRTLSAPYPSDRSNSLVLMVSMDLTDFDVKLAEFQREYPTAISWTKTAELINSPLGVNVELAPKYFMNVSVDEAYVRELSANTKYVLIVMVLVLTLMTGVLLLVLVRRFITEPVIELDQQLENVIAGDRKNIDERKGNDEISRLTQKIHMLYSQLNELLEKITNQSKSDVLTSLPNRRAFNEYAEQQIINIRRSHGTLSIIYVDLDNFKFVNDRHGHDIGDKLLQSFSEKLLRLAKCQPPENQVQAARLSGDEFVLTVSNMGPNALESFAQKILMVFDKGFLFDRGSLPVSVSVGIATAPDDGDTVSKLVSNADLALYAAKQLGRNRFEFYSAGLAAEARRKSEIIEQLKSIDFDKEFYLVYMPIVDALGIAKGVEVLVRWQSTSLGFVGPDEFIPIAENCGLVDKVDFWVIDKALQSFSVLQRIFDENFRISINMSSAHFNNTEFSSYIVNKVREHHVRPQQVSLEVTETFHSDHASLMLKMLRRLRAHGFQIEIDDFGAGYTSLEQLINNPVDGIKLDRFFLRKAFDADKIEFISALVKLCRLQNAKVIAEGVETREQMEVLLAAGCDYLQGYYFSEPLRIEQLRGYAQASGAVVLPQIGGLRSVK